MTLTCTSRHTDGTPCQEQDPRHAVHHAHDRNGANCRMWVDSGDTETRIPTACDWLLMLHEVEQRPIERRGNGAAAKLKARRERLLAEAIEDPSNEVLRARVERLRRREARANGNDFGTHPLDLDAVRDRHAYYVARRSSRPCPAHPTADDVPALLAEIERLKAELVHTRAATFTEAARLLEDTGRDDDAVNPSTTSPKVSAHTPGRAD